MNLLNEHLIVVGQKAGAPMAVLRALKWMLLLGGICLQTSCVRFQPLRVSPATSADEFESRSLADEGLKKFIERSHASQTVGWPPAEWDLTNLTLAAFYYSPDLDVARAKWAAAQAGKKTAAERPNPTLGVTPAYSTTTSIPSPWLVTPTLDIPIETAGKRGYRIAQARELTEAARLNIATAAWQVRSRVRRSLVDLYSAIQSQELLQEQDTLLAESVRLIESQNAAGAASGFEARLARQAHLTGRLALHDAEAQSTAAKSQLAEAIGIPMKALEGVKFSFASVSEFPAEMPAAEARRRALLRRTDILSALSEFGASQSALQLEIAKQYPDIHLSPGYEFDQGNNKWSLGLTVTLPILNQNKGPIAEAMAQRSAAAANFNATQARVMAEVDRAIGAYGTARKKQDDVAALLTNLEKQQKTYQGMFEAGEISRSELAAQRVQFSATALARLDAVIKAQQALGQLEDALQSPSGPSFSAWQLFPRDLKKNQPNLRP